MIAACAAATKKIHAPPDPRLSPFAEHLTMIEQISEDIACNKTRLEMAREPRIRQFWREQIVGLKGIHRAELRALVAAIRKHDDLAEQLDLIASVDGIGLPTAVAILARMPEIGRVTREQAAAIVGVAPFEDRSADRDGKRHIYGGRQRLRRSLYNAALAAAFRWNPQLIAMYRRLTAVGKPHKVALVACARKLLIYVNTVVERGTPWCGQRPSSSRLRPCEATARP